MRGTGTGRRLAAAIAVTGFLVAPPLAAAETKDRVQVGLPGRNATAGFPLGLYTSVTTLPRYRAVNHFDGDSRNWEGPLYRAPSGLGNRASTIDWQVSFLRGGSALAAAQRALVQKWPVAERPQVRIPHRVGPRLVGTIPAVALLTKGPGDNNAQYDAALAFPLCRGLFVSAHFSVLTPVSEYGTDPSDTFLVEGTPAKTWNHDRSLDALAQVALEGHLPLGRVTARAAGRAVTGIARDCRGDALAGIEVRLLSGRRVVARAKATANGSYRLTAPRPGSYRVEIAQTVSGEGGSGTRRDAKSAAVAVR